VECIVAQAWGKSARYGSGTWSLATPWTAFALVFRRRYSSELFRKRKNSSLDVRLVSVNVGSIPTHLHASIRLTLRYLLANSLYKLYRLGLLCSMFAGREGFEPVMPARSGSLSARGLRFNCHLAENN
jgi:hypothetical protein